MEEREGYGTFFQIIAYKGGVKIATLSEIRDVQLIEDWMKMFGCLTCETEIRKVI